MNKTVKIPGPQHPIAITRSAARVEVRVGDAVIASTTQALVLQEAAYPPVFYIPRKDVNMALLTPSAHTTYCPYKGDCVYFSIPAGGERSVNAVWAYEAPYESVSAIRDLLAFYPDRVDGISIL